MEKIPTIMMIIILSLIIVACITMATIVVASIIKSYKDFDDEEILTKEEEDTILRALEKDAIRAMRPGPGAIASETAETANIKIKGARRIGYSKIECDKILPQTHIPARVYKINKKKERKFKRAQQELILAKNLDFEI